MYWSIKYRNLTDGLPIFWGISFFVNFRYLLNYYLISTIPDYLKTQGSAIIKKLPYKI